MSTAEPALAAPKGLPALPRVLAASPEKRSNEIFVLAYSPIWMGVIGAVMAGGGLSRWSDIHHLLLGIGLTLPLWVYPFVTRAGRDRPLWERHATRYAVAVLVLGLLQTYFGSILFFDRLGMEYHFHTTWSLNRTPTFLYFLTVVYFSTYYVVLQIAWRAIASRIPGAPRPLLVVARLALAYAVAFGETYFMANDLLSEFFLYRDRAFMLRYGSICYATVFFVTMPLFERLDEAPEAGAARRPLWPVVRDALALNMVALVCYEAYSRWLVPR